MLRRMPQHADESRLLGGLDLAAGALALAKAGYLRSGSRKPGSSIAARVPGQGVVATYHVLGAIMGGDAAPDAMPSMAAE